MRRRAHYIVIEPKSRMVPVSCYFEVGFRNVRGLCWSLVNHSDTLTYDIIDIRLIYKPWAKIQFRYVRSIHWPFCCLICDSNCVFVRCFEEFSLVFIYFLVNDRRVREAFVAYWEERSAWYGLSKASDLIWSKKKGLLLDPGRDIVVYVGVASIPGPVISGSSIGGEEDGSRGFDRIWHESKRTRKGIRRQGMTWRSLRSGFARSGLPIEKILASVVWVFERWCIWDTVLMHYRCRLALYVERIFLRYK